MADSVPIWSKPAPYSVTATSCPYIGVTGGPGINPPHVDTILVKKFYEFFSENLGIDSTRDRYM